MATIQSNKTIMLVDDDKDQNEFISDMLKRNGFEVVVFDDPHGAILSIQQKKKPVDTIITDLCMPYLDGLEFIEILRRISPETPVVLLTAHPSIEAYFNAFSLGVREFINKPVRESEIIRVINTILGQRNRRTSPRNAKPAPPLQKSDG